MLNVALIFVLVSQLLALAEGSSDRGQALEQCYQLQRLIPGRLDDCIARNQSGR